MRKIKIEMENVGGIDSISTSIETGKINYCSGKSSSGKSSVIRGINLALSGSIPLEYKDEGDRLRKEIVMRGKENARVMIDINGGCNVNISSNGNVRSNSTTPKALFTTVISDLPTTVLHRSIFDPESFQPNKGNHDNFQWLTDTLSEAGEYQKWHRLLHSINNDFVAQQKRFEQWTNSRASEAGIIGGIDAEIIQIRTKIEEKLASKGQKDADVAKLKEGEKNTRVKYERRLKDYNDSSTALEVLEANNEKLLASIKGAKNRIKISQRRMDEAGDLMELDLNEERMMGTIRIELDKAKSDLEKLLGINDEKSIKIAKHIDDGVFNDHNDGVKGDLDEWRKGVGGDPKLIQIQQSKLTQIQSTHDSILRKLIDDQRKQTMAQQQYDAATGDIKSSRAIISSSEKSMGKDKGELSILRKNVPRDKSEYEKAKKELTSIQADIAALDDSPDAEKDRQKLKLLESQKIRAGNTGKMFEMRFASLGMMMGDTAKYTEEQARNILYPNTTHIEETIVKNNLNRSESDIRSLLLPFLENGLSSWISNTAEWVAEEAERQRTETRRIFNEVGRKLFTELNVSPIIGVGLTTDYELVVEWKGGKTTGLTGAGGERTIIAAALLIALHKAYTPEIPILMFDGILDNLDPKPRQELIEFLANYAKEVEIAVVISVLDSSKERVMFNS